MGANITILSPLEINVQVSAGNSLPLFTATRIPFAGTNGVLTEDNTLSFNNDITGNPNLFQLILGPGTVNQGAIAGLNITMNGSGNIAEYNAFGTAPSQIFRRAGGTFTSPSAILSGNDMMTLSSRGYGTTGFSTAGRAVMFATATENWTDTAQGTKFTFRTTANGTTTTTEKMVIDHNGNVGIGVTSPLYGKLQIIDANSLSNFKTQLVIGDASIPRGIAIGIDPNADGTGVGYIYDSAANIVCMTFRNGRVGIGSNDLNPQANLDIRTTSVSGGLIVRSIASVVNFVCNGVNTGLALAGGTPTARVHIGAGTATANTAPLKFTAGTNLTTVENGAMEFDGTNLYITIAGVRRTIQLV